ncbi:MAG TPA: hypothetical protein VHO24_09340 [Opitutaceae bacterium]|nr:hypothetical protein [Opitutaceae bacterium]
MKPFLHGKKTLSIEPLTPPAGLSGYASASPTRGTGGLRTGGPTVEVVKQGDKIMRLVVTCACGERVEVECLYPAGS